MGPEVLHCNIDKIHVNIFSVKFEILKISFTTKSVRTFRRIN
jgi:hypothetical protein